MKSLSLSRPLVIVMIGLPGAGKSFFARQFAETFHAPIVSHDYLRFHLFQEPAFSKEEDALIAQLATNELTELLKTQRSVIIDGGCDARTDRQAVERLAKQHGYGTLIVWVQTDEPTCRARAVKRSDRRSGDALNAPMSLEVFERLKKRLTPPSGQEDYVVVSGKHTYATQAKVVLRKFVVPRGEVNDSGNASTKTERTPTHGDDIQPRRRSVTIS